MISRIKRFIIFFYFRYLKKDLVGWARFQGVKIGNECRFYISKFGSEPFLIEIGNRVTITSGVRLITHDGANWLVKDDRGRRYSYSRIVIGNNVFIGVDSIILPGVVIEDNCIIGAGSVVTKSIPTGSIVAGNPAKIIGSFSDYYEKVLQNNYSESDKNVSKSFKQNVLSFLDSSNRPYYN